MTYNFEISYVKTTDFGYVDVLSRLMMQHSNSTVDDFIIANVTLENDVKAILNDTIHILPLTFKMIQNESNRDAVILKIKQIMQTGWPISGKHLHDDVVPFFSRRDALSVIDDCLMFKDRLVIPFKFRRRVLKIIHRGHPDVEAMKAVARSYVYWPNIDQDITNVRRQCSSCDKAAKSPSKMLLHPWPTTVRPMERVHMDIAGPVYGFYYIVIIDAFSKWPEIFHVKSISSKSVISKMCEVIARFGQPDKLVTDNGTQFKSVEFAKCCSERGIQHYTTAYYHPQSNGEAERYVDTLKRVLVKLEDEGSVEENVNTFLEVYRSTPNRILNGKSPAELFIGRQTKGPLDLLTRNKAQTEVLSDYGRRMVKQYNSHHRATMREFIEGDRVMAQVYKSNHTSWVPGTIVEQIGNVNYNVWAGNRLIRSHVNQLRPRQWYDANIDQEIKIDLFSTVFDFTRVPMMTPQTNSQSTVNGSTSPAISISNESDYGDASTEFPEQHQQPQDLLDTRRPIRSTHPPAYLSDYVTH